jgi:hypothetical protein
MQPQSRKIPRGKKHSAQTSKAVEAPAPGGTISPERAAQYEATADPATERFIELLDDYGSEPAVQARLMFILDGRARLMEPENLGSGRHLIKFNKADKFTFRDQVGNRILEVRFTL